MQKFYIIGGILLAIILGIAGAHYYFRHALQPSGIACTQEAKQCPDGSYVGRTGPDCAFAACPASQMLSADVYPLYPGAVWGEETAASVESLAGHSVTSQSTNNISDLSSIFTPFEAYYKQKLKALGWSEDTSLEAGGAGSEIVAYKKAAEHILLSYNTVFHGGSVGGPVQCPCDITLSVFSTNGVAADYKTIPYVVDGQPLQYFGNDAVGDLNGDGKPDAAVILTQSPGGSGTFYYVAVALKTDNGYTATNAVLLGDRIAPQTTSIANGEVVVNYADRKPTDPMTTAPSVGVTKYLKVSGTQFLEVAQ